MTQIISVIQLKGGAGKSTVATNLAAMLAEIGSTLLIDADEPQYTAESWHILREEHGFTENLELTTAKDEHAIAAELRRLSALDAAPDYIVIDGPARMKSASQYMMAISELVIVPMGTAKADLWSTFDFEEIVNLERKERPDLLVRLLLNKFRNATNSAHEVAAEAKKELTIPLMKTTLGYRVSYSDALGEGLCVDETRDTAAADEIRSLTKEVLRLLKGVS
jgi:chromosome partitioning protein